MPEITDVRDISRIAYGFMGSKALFAGLGLELFGRLTGQPKSLDALIEETGVAGNRLATLLAALTALGLLVKDDDLYRNAAASERYLAPSGPGYFGDYYRFQIDRQMYPALTRLDAGLAGDEESLVFHQMEGLLSDPEEADAFSRAQHAGSMGPALLLANTVDLSGSRTLLDVGGGSGAFSISLCRRYPEMTATIVDFPNVIEVGRRYVEEAGLASRIRLLPGNALSTEWPQGHDVVLMSYLLSAVGASDFPELFAKARECLCPGGLLLVHDFMLEDDRAGPSLAAFWFLTNLALRSDCVSFSSAELGTHLSAQGFVDIASRELIPEITKLVSARKRP